MNHYKRGAEVLSDYRDLAQELGQLEQLARNIPRLWKISGSMPEGAALELMAHYNREIETGREILTAAKTAAERIQDPVRRQLIITHYINGETWENTAEKLCYSLTQTFRLRDSAMMDFLDNYNFGGK